MNSVTGALQCKKQQLVNLIVTTFIIGLQLLNSLQPFIRLFHDVKIPHALIRKFLSIICKPQTCGGATHSNVNLRL